MHPAFPFHASVFYPGSGHDCRAIRAFVLTGEADTFIQVDYGIPQEEIRDRLSREGLRLLSQEDLADIALEAWDDEAPNTIKDLRNLPDYELKSLEDLPFDTLFPAKPENHLPNVPIHFPDGGPQVPPYALLGRFEIRAGHPSAKAWPKQLQVLFLSTEAISTYDRLFCQAGQQSPKAVVIQPGMHVGGNNWHPIHLLAQETGRLPEYLLLLDQAPIPWEGYEPVEGNLWRRIG